MALTPIALAAAYFGIGLVGAGLVLHRGRGGDGARPLASAAAMLVVWPLWAPFALSPTLDPEVDPEVDPDLATAPDHPLATRISEALRADGAFEAHERGQVQREVDRAAARLLEVERLLERERHRPNEGQQVPSALHGAARRRLEAARTRDLRNLEALAELVELLGAELVLARHGSTIGTDELVTALWARVEMLHELD